MVSGHPALFSALSVTQPLEAHLWHGFRITSLVLSIKCKQAFRSSPVTSFQDNQPRSQHILWFLRNIRVRHPHLVHQVLERVLRRFNIYNMSSTRITYTLLRQLPPVTSQLKWPIDTSVAPIHTYRHRLYTFTLSVQNKLWNATFYRQFYSSHSQSVSISVNVPHVIVTSQL